MLTRNHVFFTFWKCRQVVSLKISNTPVLRTKSKTIILIRKIFPLEGFVSRKQMETIVITMDTYNNLIT